MENTMNGPFDGPYCGHVPTANTSLHNISMDQMQMLMGVNTGAAIVKRQQQEDMAYLAALAVENANIAQNEFENGLYQGRHEGYQAAQAEIEHIKHLLMIASGDALHWEKRYQKMQENTKRALSVIDANKLQRPKLFRYKTGTVDGLIVEFTES